MPTLSPDKSHRSGLNMLITFLRTWRAEDPVRASSLPGAATLEDKLAACIREIDGSLLWVKKIEINADETNALFYLTSLHAMRVPGSSGTQVASLYVQELSRQVKLLAMPDSHVGPNPLFQTTRYARRVFLVCGRAREMMLELERWLRGFGLEVVVLETETVPGATLVAQALEDKVAGCGTGIVLATADDYGRLAGGPPKLYPRARQNVVLELGLLWGLLGTRRLVLVLQEAIADDFPTDTAGFMTIRFQEHVRDAFDGIRSKLQEMAVLAVGPAK
jgi:predicted nucleotide-binding protein